MSHVSHTFALGTMISLAAGFVLGCIYVLLRTRKERDASDPQMQSLKQTAKEMIENGNLTGLNPHKVYKFCCRYEQMTADNKRWAADVRDMCEAVNRIHRDCEYVEDLYYVPEQMLLDILERK